MPVGKWRHGCVVEIGAVGIWVGVGRSRRIVDISDRGAASVPDTVGHNKGEALATFNVCGTVIGTRSFSPWALIVRAGIVLADIPERRSQWGATVYTLVVKPG